MLGAVTPRRLPGRFRCLLLLSGLSLASPGCELVLGDIPPNPQLPDAQLEDDAGAADGGVDEDAASDEDLADAGDASEPDELDADMDAGDLDAEVSEDDAMTADEDSSVEPTQDSGVDAGKDASAPSDAGHEPENDAAVPCTPLTWYADEDDDKEGNSAKTVKACVKPAGKWVDHGGDCADNDARAHHGQTTYFGTSYAIAGGKDSFDFDCSGQEEPWAGQALAPASCSPTPIDCKGSGYAKTDRTGPGVYAYCGSKTDTACKVVQVIFCSPVNTTVTAPFLCR